MLAFFKTFFASVNGQRLYKIGRDAAEAAFAAILVLNLSIPNDLDQAKAQAVVIGTAAFGAIVSVIRRELIPWIVGLS